MEEGGEEWLKQMSLISQRAANLKEINMQRFKKCIWNKIAFRYKLHAGRLKKNSAIGH